MQFMDLKELLQYGEDKLKNIDNGKNEARMFIEDLFNLKISDVFGTKNINFSDNEIKLYEDAIRKRLKHIPYNYIVGFKEFYDNNFKVDSRVLVPRQETELMIDYLVKYYKDRKPSKILDLCTGSGCIGITLNLIFKVETVISDISKDALDVARLNNISLNSNVKIVESDLFNNIDGKFDLITINPPYVPEERAKFLSDEVTKYEPRNAIFTEDNGMKIIKRFLNEFIDYTKNNFLVVMEIDESHRSYITEYLKDTSLKYFFLKDFQNMDRFLVIERSEYNAWR